MPAAKTVDEYIARKPEWAEALTKLRCVAISTGMEEAIKWGGPAYLLDGKNVCGLAAFQSYVGIWFFQGALLKDEAGLLQNAQEGKTKAMRQWRFDSAAEIDEKQVLTYLHEAMENQRQGKVIQPDRSQPKVGVIPEELKAAFREDDALAQAFQGLSPSCQREYASYIAEAKRAATRLNRVQKVIPMILEKQGLNERYR